MNDHETEAGLEEARLRELGLLDPDQPTEYAHIQHQRAMRAPFTPQERELIRAALGIPPFGTDTEGSL